MKKSKNKDIKEYARDIRDELKGRDQIIHGLWKSSLEELHKIVIDHKLEVSYLRNKEE